MNPYTIEFLEELYKGFSSSRKKIRKETLKKLKGAIAQEKAKRACKVVFSKDGIRFVTLMVNVFLNLAQIQGKTIPIYSIRKEKL